MAACYYDSRVYEAPKFDTEAILGLQFDGKLQPNSLNSICTVSLPPVREQVRSRGEDGERGEACDRTVLLSQWAERKRPEKEIQRVRDRRMLWLRKTPFSNRRTTQRVWDKGNSLPTGGLQ